MRVIFTRIAKQDRQVEAGSQIWLRKQLKCANSGPSIRTPMMTSGFTFTGESAGMTLSMTAILSLKCRTS